MAELHPWKWQAHHDDPPCCVKLRPEGKCPACGFHPDMQSTMLRAYCPDCDAELDDNDTCKFCKETYRRP